MYTYLNRNFILPRFIQNFIQKLLLFKINFFQSDHEVCLPACISQEEPAQTQQPGEQILNTYGNTILRLAYSYLHNMADAEDILQETLIRYLTSAPEFQNPDHEKSWLLKVAANLSKNRIRYNKHRDTDELSETLVAENRPDLSFVWDAVRSLPIKYRSVIHLFYYEGYTSGEISKILGRKSSSVRSDLRRGREQLKSILKEAYDFDQLL